MQQSTMLKLVLIHRDKHPTTSAHIFSKSNSNKFHDK